MKTTENNLSLFRRMVMARAEAAPKYETVPLQHDEIAVAAVQMNPVPVDIRNPAKGIKKNLERILYLCDASTICFPFGTKHLIVFPEWAMTGYDILWTREDWLKTAIMVPGPETQAIGRKARELGSYVVLACHTQDPDWPKHFFNTSLIISPEGKVIHTHWKAYSGFPGIGTEWSTTVADVLDEFVDRYGWEAVWPVARTPIGNLATYICSEGFFPETARIFALEGAEILCRCYGHGGFGNVGDKQMLLFRADCAFSDLYGVYANGGSGPTIEGKGSPENDYGGGTMIVDPSGVVISQTGDSRETIITGTIPIGLFRKKHSPPHMRMELYVPSYERHPAKFPPNLYSEYLPTDAEDALNWARKRMRR